MTELADLTTLHELVARYRAVIDLMSDIAFEACFEADGAVRFVWITPSFQRITGHTLDDLHSPDAWLSIVHPEDREIAARQRELLSQNGEVDFETRLIGRDGEVRYLRVAARLDGGRIFGGVRDVTGERTVQDTLRESEKRYRLLTHATNDVVWSWDLATNRMTWSSGVERIFGYAPEHVEPLFEWWHERLHPEDRDRVVECNRRFIESSGDSAVAEYRFRCHDGSYASVIHRVFAVRDPGGRTLRLLGAMTDVSAQRAAEQQLRDAASKLRALTHAFPDLYFRLDAEGRVIEQVAGHAGSADARQSWAGRTLAEILPAPAAQVCLGAVGETLRRAEAVSVEYWLPSSDGRRLYEGRVLPLWESQVLFAVRDVTDLRHTEAALRVAHSELASRSAELTETVDALHQEIAGRARFERELRESRRRLRALSRQLLSVQEEERRRIAREVHDELGQLLTAVRFDAVWLERHVQDAAEPLNTRARKMIELIDRTLQTVRRIARDLRPGALDDLGLVAAIEDLARQFQERTGVGCRLSVGPEEISLDPQRSVAVFRLVQETLTNVARHAGANRVEIDLSCDGEALNVIVRDDGRGITRRQIANAHSLGIIGMRERVRLCGGRLHIEGQENGGTTVKARIPLKIGWTIGQIARRRRRP